jgi:hypothetical protein
VSSREVRKFVYHAIRHGVDITKPPHAAHYAVWLDGQRVGTIPYSPSDSRWRQNAIAEIRRGTGVDLRTTRRARKLARDAQPAPPA